MGCTQSKIENEEAVSRCKERKQFMKEAVSSRNAFAAAHFAYTVALKNTGAALNDYAQAEVLDPTTTARPSSSASSAVAAGSSSAASTSTAAAAVGQPPMENLPPPPPPLPEFSPLQRSTSMPEIPLEKPRRRNPNPNTTSSIREEDDGVNDLEEDVHGVGPAAESTSPAPPPPPPPQSQPIPTPPPPPAAPGMTSWDYFFAMDENMPPSLGDVEEIQTEKENRREEEEKDKFRRSAAAVSAASTSSPVGANVDGGHGSHDDIDMTPPVTPEKLVVDTPPMPPKLVKKQKGVLHHQHALSVGPGEAKRGKTVADSGAPSVNLLHVLIDLDDHFLKASESAHTVSKMLEANRMHYHSNFADNRGHIDHSARVMRVITWNRSFKGMPNTDDGKDDFDSEEWETHATILDKLLAWEKKLYDEVKAGELMKLEYQRKVALLNKQKKHNVSPETLEKTKAAVSHLHTRYIVDMQSMDSTVSEIQRLRDDQLYPKLAALVDGMTEMWENMYKHHHCQLKIVADIKSFDNSNAPNETTEQHYDRTVQLYKIVSDWHLQFQRLIAHQKEYIQALNSWLRLNLIPIESSLKEKLSSPPRVYEPPIKALIHAWQDQLEKLPYELAKAAILSFSAVINTIMTHQQDEMKQRDKCEETKREYTRKSRAFQDWCDKRRPLPSEEVDPEAAENENQKDPVADRRIAVESLKKRLEDELEEHQKLCKQSREKSRTSLKTHLPELFRALSDFALACSDMYKHLRAISQTKEPAAS